MENTTSVVEKGEVLTKTAKEDKRARVQMNTLSGEPLSKPLKVEAIDPFQRPEEDDEPSFIKDVLFGAIGGVIGIVLGRLIF